MKALEQLDVTVQYRLSIQVDELTCLETQMTETSSMKPTGRDTHIKSRLDAGEGQGQ